MELVDFVIYEARLRDASLPEVAEPLASPIAAFGAFASGGTGGVIEQYQEGRLSANSIADLFCLQVAAYRQQQSQPRQCALVDILWGMWACRHQGLARESKLSL